MRHVPLVEFQTNIAEFVAAAQAGEEVVVTDGGYESLRLVRTSAERMEQQRAAVDALYRLGQEIRAKHGPTTATEIREWIEDGRP